MNRHIIGQVLLCWIKNGMIIAKINIIPFVINLSKLSQDDVGEGGAAEERGGIHTLFP